MDRDEPFLSVKNLTDYSVPSVGSDDEDSFVVLGTSASISSLSENVSCSLPREEILPPIRTNKVHEMENLIKMEISQINATQISQIPPAVDGLDALASAVRNIAISPDSSYEEIQKQVEELIKENEKLKNIIAQNNMSMKTQYTRFLSYRDEVNDVMKSYKDKFNQAKMCIEKIKDENVKLANDMEVYINIKKLHEEEIINLKQKVRDLENSQSVIGASVESDPKLATEKVKELQTELAQANLKNSELSSNLDKLKQEIEQVTAKLVATTEIDQSEAAKQIQDLKGDLMAAEIVEKKLHGELHQLKNDHLLTLSRYQGELVAKDGEILRLKKELQMAAVVESSLREKVATSEDKLKQLQQTYDLKLLEDYGKSRAQLSLAQQTITALEQDREAKCKEIENLRKLLQNSAQNDEMYALKEQIDLYKSDFEAEKRSKEEMKRERDQLVEDLQNVQKRNQQLQNEIEVLRARTQPKSEGYSCPKCSFGFSTYQSLENHVHRCLDLDGFP